MAMLKLYDFLDSGNGYKVRLLLHQLQRPFVLVEKDILRGETRTEDFLKLNPDGRIPVLQLEDGACLAQSNAILFYLAEGTPYLPTAALERARVLQWMGFEQYSHEPHIATARFWLKHPEAAPAGDQLPALLEQKRASGHAALAVLERHLAAAPFLVEGRYTVADIALYAYTHVAHEGGFDLAPYPAVRAWLERIAAQPRHVPITWRP